VSPAGELAYAELSVSSGSTALDEAALAAVRRSAPFGPPPSDVLPSELRFSIRITYR
jgi:TonB family protein